ncbi:TIGR02206 family membrane protein [Oceanobacillus piezotolerans]|uniref:TIGR02206 family membrane protein n=1 Tax=Oceanobacillus piezotolerans TaxID=2448030 RepID=A0A498D297_9BACI|nr:TIGR02206 family membrane protein [Oceanobacillus piezotolerans]RLL40620.1 TIGR02206 family membrane protein [Oceanobacillus piezotolerans]
MSDYFSYQYTAEVFSLFSISHIIMLILALVLCAAMIVFRNDIRRTPLRKWVRVSLIIALILSESTLNIWYFTTGAWDVKETLPLQLCSLSLLFSIVMLITRSYRLFEILYFLGIGGALQALLTPELFYDFPHYRYFHFFIAHICIILASLYMVAIERYRIKLSSIWKAMIAINSIALIVFFINKWIGANYMFLAQKPSNPSILDYLPDYPFYIFYLEIIALILFILLYLPVKGAYHHSNFIENGQKDGRDI